MKKTKKKFLSPRTIIISLILLGGIVYSLYRVVPRSLQQPLDVFVIEEPVVYGETTITGNLYKDAAIGKPGNYYLATDNNKAFMLDVTGVDQMVGLSVTVSGYLYPPASESTLPYMIVSDMRSN